MKKPQLLILASGSATDGGSGAENLILHSRSGVLDADIVMIASNHENGGVRKRATKHNVPFEHFPGPWDAAAYQRLAEKSGADFFALSGWLKLVDGLDPSTKFNSCTVFNIHPGPLPTFGGPRLYGHHVHDAVFAAFKRGEITHSAVSMHFVTGEYDRGPVFFERPVKLLENDTAETIKDRVNKQEHLFQPLLTNQIVKKQITWDGVNASTLTGPGLHSFKMPLIAEQDLDEMERKRFTEQEIEQIEEFLIPFSPTARLYLSMIFIRGKIYKKSLAEIMAVCRTLWETNWRKGSSERFGDPDDVAPGVGMMNLEGFFGAYRGLGLPRPKFLF